MKINKKALLLTLGLLLLINALVLFIKSPMFDSAFFNGEKIEAPYVLYIYKGENEKEFDNAISMATNPEITNRVNFIIVNTKNSNYDKYIKMYSIEGSKSLLIVNPATGSVIKKMTSIPAEEDLVEMVSGYPKKSAEVVEKKE